MKKQEAFDESRKLKNVIRGLDNDEFEFLQAIDNNKAELENQMFQEELMAIDEYKRGVTDLNVEEQEKRLLEFKRELFKIHKKKDEGDAGHSKRKAPSQAELLSKVIKRKLTHDEPNTSAHNNNKKANQSEEWTAKSRNDLKNGAKFVPPPNTPTIQLIGRLPGIGCYDDNSDSDDSDRESDEDEAEDFQVFADPSESSEHAH